MIIAGYLASVLIGVSLGLIGGGGSILTVPVLVYLFDVDAAVATTYSLFVVGTTSVVGSVSYLKKGLVSVRTAVVFGLPSIVSVFATRTYLVPLIPAHVATVAGVAVSKSMLLMVLFAVLMLAASYSMIKKGGPEANEVAAAPNYGVVLVQGVFVGMVTGLIGAGGGFLIIPALVNLLRLPMKMAVGTSLVIIATNSLAGFAFSIGKVAIDWGLVLAVAGIAVGGILVGSYLSTKVDGKRLKPAFGWFVLVMGMYILAKELLLK